MIENLSFFTDNDFSTTAIVVSSGQSISGIFDEEYAPMLEGSTEGRLITFCCQTIDIEELHHGDSLEIDERTFKVVGIQPHGDGKLTDLVLKGA